MSRHSQLAEELFEKGYNCAQSVVVAFCDETGLDLEDALKISSSFGGGMGGLREVCGAVTGMFMIAGLLYGYSDPLDIDSKRGHYELIQKLAISFNDKYDSIICRDLLGLDVENENPKPQERNKKYYKSRPCGEFVGYAAKIMDEHIQNKKMEESNDKNCGSQ